MNSQRSMTTSGGARGPRRGTRSRAVALLACLPFVLAACSSGSDPETTSGTATSPNDAQGANSQTAGPGASGTDGGTAPAGSATGGARTQACDTTGFATSVPGDTALSRLIVSNARVGQQSCVDRFVIEMSGDPSITPGYQVRYVPQVLQEGSGTVVPLRGRAFLHVGVGAPSSDQAGQATYVPANRAEVADVSGYNAFRQVAWAGSFEGMTTFGIGVREQLPFKVSVLTEDGRTRLVLDVAHAAS